MPISKITLENFKGISDRTGEANLEPSFKFPATPFNYHR